MYKILFVCTGNICRSPTADGYLRHVIKNKRLQNVLMSDSAGTHGYHVGHAPDRRSVQAGLSRGIDISSLKARQFDVYDFKRFDLILAMDRGHFHTMQALVHPSDLNKIKLFSDYLPNKEDSFQKVIDIPDPYYDDEQVFEYVCDLIVAGVDGIIKKMQDTKLI